MTRKGFRQWLAMLLSMLLLLTGVPAALGERAAMEEYVAPEIEAVATEEVVFSAPVDEEVSESKDDTVWTEEIAKDVELYNTKRLENEAIEKATTIRINRTNFPDKLFRNYVKENFDLNSNGKLSKSERLAVKEIDVSNMGIKNLKGIERFPNLENLDCTNNKLKKLDVSMNEELVELYCSENQLSELDVSDNEELQYLVCRANKLTKLDVKGCEKLMILECSNNKLKQLNVSKKSELRMLWCNDNNIKKLKLWQCEQLYQAYIYGNKLKNVAITGSQGLINQINGKPNEKYSDIEGTLYYGNPENEEEGFFAFDATTRFKVGREYVFAAEPISVELNKTEASVKVGKKVRLKAEFTPAATNTNVTWKSSDKTVATVSKKGVVKGRKPGTAQITVETVNGKSATCEVTVKKTGGTETPVNRRELKAYLNTNAETMASELGLYFERSGFRDTEDTVFVETFDYNSELVWNIGLFGNNTTFSLEGVYPGMSYEDAETHLLGLGYAHSTVEREDGSVEQDFKKDNYRIDCSLENGIIISVYMRWEAEATEETIELSGYWNTNAQEAAEAIGGLTYSGLFEMEDGIDSYYDNDVLSLSVGDNTVICIRLVERSDYALKGLKIGMSLSEIKNKMSSYQLRSGWDEFDGESSAEYIISGTDEEPEVMMYISVGSTGANKIEYGMWP